MSPRVTKQIDKTKLKNKVETLLVISLYIQGHHNGVSGLVCWVFTPNKIW